MSFSSSLKWTTDASLTSGTDEGAADYVNGRLYVIDGFGSAASSSILVYDSALNTWQTDSAHDLVARFDLASAVDASGNIYLIDGTTGSGSLTEVTKFDPFTDTVVQVASTGTARLGAAAATAANGKIYLFGGLTLSSGEVYDPNTNSWSGIASMPKALAFESAVADGSVIYIIGGTTTGDATGDSSSVYAYDTTTNTWSAPLASLPTAVMGATAGLVDGMIVVAGGLNSGDADIATTQIYDPTTNTWTTASSSIPVAEEVAGQGMVSSGSQLFVAGGDANNTALQVASVTPATSQLFFRINNGNDDQLGDINSNGTGRNSIYYGGGDTSGKPQNTGINSGNDTAVAVDTAAGLVFSVGIDGPLGTYDSFSVHNLNTGALIETVSLGGGDNIVQALAINPFTDTLYVGDWGDDQTVTGVAVFTYNPSTGLVTASSSGTGPPLTQVTTTINGNATIATDSHIYLFTGSDVPNYTNANAYFLDTKNNLLYYVNDDTGYNVAPFSPVNSVDVYNIGTHTNTQLTSATQFPAGTGGDGSVGANGNLLGLAVDVADGIVFFESTDVIGSSNNALWWVSTTGADQTAHQITLPGGVTLSFAGETNEGGDAAGLTFDQEAGQLYLSNADTSNTDGDAIYVLQWNNTSKTVSLVTSYSTETLVGAAPAPDEAPSTTTIDDLPVLTLGSATTTEPVQGSATAVTLLTSATSITDADGGHLASATIAITSDSFSGDELFVNGQQSGTLDGGAITVAWDNTNKILTLTGYDTLTEYATLFGEVSFKETGNDTANIGSHTARTITWQANDGAVGDPSGTNTATTTVIIDRPPTQMTQTIDIFEGAISGPAPLNDTDPDSDPLTLTTINSPAGSVGSAVTGTYGSLTITSGDTYTYTANQTGNINGATNGSHPVDTFTYTVSDGNGGTTLETVKFSIDRPPVAMADAYRVNEGSNIGGTGSPFGTGVLHNDSDPDGDSFTVEDVNGSHANVANSVAGTYGELTLNADGSFTYTADQTAHINSAAPGVPPTDIFNYTIIDSLGDTSTTANIIFTVDRPPTVTTSNHTVTFAEGGSPVVIDSGVQVVDLDATGIESATVTISNFQAGDVLGIDPSQLTGNQIDGTNITESYNGSGTLTLTGNDNATDYQIALDEVIFSNTGPLSLTPRTIQFSTTGGTGAQSNPANADTVDVVQGPQVTVLTLNGLEEGISTGTVTVATFTDSGLTNPTPSDFSGTINWGDGSSLTPFTSADITGGPGLFSVTGAHTYSEEGLYTISVAVTDTGNATGTASDSETVADAPLTMGIVTVSGGVEGTTAATLSAAFTDGNTLAPTSDFSGTIDWGDGNTTNFTKSDVTANGNGSFTVSGSHTYAEEGPDNVTVTINDLGGSTVTESGTTTVADAALTAGSVTVSGGVEGVTVAALSATFTDANLSAPASDFSGTIDWGDNTSTHFTNGDVTSNGNGSITVSGLSHLYTEEGTYNVSVAINDVGGSATTDAGMTTVADAALTAGALTPPVATEGVALSNAVAFHFTDANPNATTGDFTASINWGDGNTTAGTVVAHAGGGFDVEDGGHTYAEEGPYTFGVTVTDTGGASTTASSNIFVADVPLTAGTATVNGGVEGVTAAALHATFTDGNTLAPTSDFSGTITWGDGKTTPFTSSNVTANGNGSFTLSGLSHLYTEDGSYNVSVAINDVGGQFTTDTGTATVADAALSAAGKTIAGTEGVALSATVATFTDANPNAPLSDFTATVNWGDGTMSSGTVAAQAGGGFAVTGTHTYATQGTFTTSVTVHDAGGSTAQASGTADVGTPPLSATHHVNVVEGGTIGPQSAGDSDPDSDTITVTGITGGTLGSPVSGTYGTLTLNANDTFSYTANNRAAINAAPSGIVTDAFTYTVSDGHGGTATETLDVSVHRPPVQGNFFGNGISGVLWRNTTNETFIEWQMNGAAITASDSAIYMGSVTTPASSWHVVGSGDFNGDGKTDILWQFSDGSVADWTMNGSTISASDYLRFQGQVVAPDSSWSIAGIGDFNGDGNADLLWRNTNGSLAEWLMNGSTITESDTPGFQGSTVRPDSSWNVAAVGDFNGDGDADVIWRQSTTGALAEWQMNGATITSSANVTAQGVAATPDSSWSIAGVGDFNGDGREDLLWRQSTTGSLVEWLMNGSQIAGSAQVTSQGSAVTPDHTWNLLEVGDFNGDGKADLLWQQSTTGALVEWQMNGTQIASSQTVTSQGAPIALSNVWQVQAFPTNVA